MNVKPVSVEKKSPEAGRGCMVAFGTLFLLAGLGFLAGTLIYPIIRTQSSADWQETPCTISSSKIDINRGDGGTSYRPKITFEYIVNDQTFVGDSYDFTALNRPKKRCHEIVTDHPPGMVMTCFVNPDDPADAVIVRNHDFSWVGTIVSLVIAAIGLAIALCALFYTPKPSNSISGAAKAPSHSVTNSLGPHSNKSDAFAGTSGSSRHLGDIADESMDKPQKLVAEHGRLTTFLGMLAFAIFWNGIVSVFVYVAATGGFEGFTVVLCLFLIPFIIVGLILIGAVFQKFAGLFNPKVELALTTGAVDRGASVDVAWQLEGRTSALRALSIKVEGEESATYRRGTDTITDKDVFCTIPVAEIQSGEEIEFGSRTVTIPVDTMHTFKGDRNRITWRIVVHGDIPWWADIKESYEFRVKP